MISQICPETSTIGTVARKRRRQIILSQRTKVNEDESPASKKTRIELITSPETAHGDEIDVHSSTVTQCASKNQTKKPQMRYDPGVPMTKEETAAWRKEQRRKRNRESAAASRQRQRDRIAELEEEVSEWKLKYEEALKRIEGLEKGERFRSMDCTVSTASLSPEESTAISPCASPLQYPSSPVLSTCLTPPQGKVSYNEIVSPIACRGIHEGSNHVVKHLSEKISRPA
jgi:hypothetical protein